MDGLISKAGLLVVVIVVVVWGFCSLLDQVGRDVADLKRQAAALSMASDADQAGRIGADLARR